MSAHETTGWKPVVHDRQDAYPPAKSSVLSGPSVISSAHGQGARAPLADILAHGGPDSEALEQQLLTRLVALNHERAADFQRREEPSGSGAFQDEDASVAERDFRGLPGRALVEAVQIRFVVGNPFLLRRKTKILTAQARNYALSPKV